MERSLQWSRPASLLLFAAAFLAAAAVASAGYNPDPLSVVNHFNRAVQRHASLHHGLIKLVASICTNYEGMHDMNI
jgi:hypothetical protein